MADIFLSYARADQPRIEKLAAALEDAGHSIWWDRQIEGGHQFAKDIQREIEAAGKVIVAWSASSIESHWVLDEAGYARDAGKLLPISLDKTLPPLGYRQIQAIDFSRWPKDGQPFEQLQRALGNAAPAPPAAKPRSRRKPLLIAGTAIALALAGGAYVITQGVPGFEEAQAQPVMLAVLPFTSSDEELASRGQGMSSALSNGLADARNLNLIASTSAAAAASRNLSAKEIGEQLGATHLLEGEILPAGEDQVQIILTLVDTGSGRQIWTDRVEGYRGLGQSLVRQLVEKAGLAMNARLGTGQTGRVAGDDISPEAYDAYLSALENLSLRIDMSNRQEAYRQLVRVTELAPDFAPGHAALATIIAQSSDGLFGERDAVAAQQREAVAQALQLDPGNVEARAAQSMAATQWEYDVAHAIELARKLIEDHPTAPQAHEALAFALDYGGYNQEAHPHYERVLLSDPLSEQKRVNMLENYMKFGTFDGLQRLIDRCQDCSRAPIMTIMGLIYLGDRADFERMWPAFEARSIRDGVPNEAVNELENFFSAMMERRSVPLPASLENNFNPWVVSATMRTRGEEAALEMIDANNSMINPLPFMVDGPVAFSPAARADPRYALMFQHPFTQGIVAYRRKQGFMAGLPLEPHEVAAEERRIAALPDR